MSDGGYLSESDLQFMQDYASSPLNYAIPDIAGYNPYTGGSTGGGFGVDQLGKAIQYGVQAYGQIKAIDHGGYANYPPAAPQPAPQDQGDPYTSQPQGSAPAGGFDWSQFTNFSTPYPYAAGIGGLLVLTLMMRAMRR